MASKPKFALHPGYVKSRNDKGSHYIGVKALARLYELHEREYIVWNDETSRGRNWDDYIHLYPNREGNYGRPNDNK